MPDQRALHTFNVIREAADFEGRGTLIHCFDDLKLILTVVPREAVEDYFGLTALTSEQRALLVDRNIESFKSIIEAKYRAHLFGSYEGHGRSYPLLTVTEHDMRDSRLEFTSTVLEMARRSGFVQA